MSTPNLSLLVCEFIRYQSSVWVGVLVCFRGSSRLRSVIGRTDERTLPKNERGSKNENPRSSNEVKQSDESNHPSLQNTKHHRLSSLVTLVSRLSCVARLDRYPSSPPHPRMQHNAREIVALSEEQIITKNNSNTVEHISYNPYILYLGSTLAADKVSIV